MLTDSLSAEVTLHNGLPALQAERCEGQVQEIAAESKIPALTLRLVYQQALEDPGIDRLYHFRAQLAAMDGGETAANRAGTPSPL